MALLYRQQQLWKGAHTFISKIKKNIHVIHLGKHNWNQNQQLFCLSYFIQLWYLKASTIYTWRSLRSFYMPEELKETFMWGERGGL